MVIALTAGEIAGLLAAIAFTILVALTAVPLLKLGRVLEELRLVIRDTGHEAVPILTELKGTVSATNEEISKLAIVTEDVSVVSRNAASVSGAAANLAGIFSATLGGPLVRLGAITYGLRSAAKGKKTIGSNLKSTPKKVK